MYDTGHTIWISVLINTSRLYWLSRFIAVILAQSNFPEYFIFKSIMSVLTGTFTFTSYNFHLYKYLIWNKCSPVAQLSLSLSFFVLYIRPLNICLSYRLLNLKTFGAVSFFRFQFGPQLLRPNNKPFELSFPLTRCVVLLKQLVFGFLSIWFWLNCVLFV